MNGMLAEEYFIARFVRLYNLWDGQDVVVKLFHLYTSLRALLRGSTPVGKSSGAVSSMVPSRVVLEFADASSGGMRLSDHAARSMI
jgi:hypothetical protein